MSSVFDDVLLNRTLHHVHPLQSALAKVKRLLVPSGRLICQDYAYDLLSELTASWLYALQRLLFLSGLADDEPGPGQNEAHAIETLRTAWFQRAEQHLHRADELFHGLQTTFHQHIFARVPYLFISTGNGIRHAAPEQERALLTFLKNWEQSLIEKGQRQAVGLRSVGSL